jgi:hypothetical protein
MPDRSCPDSRWHVAIDPFIVVIVPPGWYWPHMPLLWQEKVLIAFGKAVPPCCSFDSLTSWFFQSTFVSANIPIAVLVSFMCAYNVNPFCRSFTPTLLIFRKYALLVFVWSVFLILHPQGTNNCLSVGPWLVACWLSSVGCSFVESLLLLLLFWSLFV